MKLAHIFPVIVLAFVCMSASPTPQPATLAPDSFDYKKMLGEPPADGSAEQKKEIETMIDLQAHRTPEEIERCKKEVSESPMVFAQDIVGKWFDAKALPLTNELLMDATRFTGVVVSPAKKTWNRKRPYTADPRITPCVHLETSTSYPSGHTARGLVWAIVIGEMFPEHRDELLARGRQYGTDRTLGGVHYPSDVVAGQKLGAEIAKRMLADPDFHARLEKAREECLAGAKH